MLESPETLWRDVTKKVIGAGNDQAAVAERHIAGMDLTEPGWIIEQLFTVLLGNHEDGLVPAARRPEDAISRQESTAKSQVAIPRLPTVEAGIIVQRP